MTVHAVRVALPDLGAGLRAPRRRVLDGVSLVLRPGEVVALLGANGAGKSTLLRVVQGLVTPVDGEVVVTTPPALAFADERSFHWRLSVRENLRFAAALQGAPTHRIDALLALVGLADRAETPVRACSTGMRARLGLARALLRDPRLLLLDEAERGLDPGGRMMLRRFLRDRAERSDCATLVATHDLTAAGCFSRAVVLEAGRVAHDGAPGAGFAMLAAATGATDLRAPAGDP